MSYADDIETDSCKPTGDLRKLSQQATKSRNPSSTSSLTSMENVGLETYRMRKNGRRLAVLINMITFTCRAPRLPARKLSDVDEAVVSSMLDGLGFEVFLKRDYTKQDLQDFFQELSMWDYKNVDVLAVVLMSYGDNREIYTSDGSKVDIRDLLDNLKGNNCPGLAGKPKLVFINAGTWEEEPEDLDDAGYDVADACAYPVTEPEKKICIPKEADFIYIYSPVTFGHQSRGFVEQGNIFLTALGEMCLQLEDEAMEFCDLLTRTNHQVALSVSSSSQVPARPCFFLSTLTKELYLKSYQRNMT